MDIPTLPEILAEMKRILAGSDLSVERVGEVIERDPAVASMMLRLANSPIYGSRETIKSIRRACVFLGLGMINQVDGDHIH